MRYLDFKSVREVEQLTVPEYKLLMKGVRLKQIDMDYRNHLQAFLNLAVKAEKKAGKGKTRPVFSKFKKFYDYKRKLDEAFKSDQQESRFSGFGKFLKSRREKEDG